MTNRVRAGAGSAAEPTDQLADVTIERPIEDPAGFPLPESRSLVTV